LHVERDPTSHAFADVNDVFRFGGQELDLRESGLAAICDRVVYTKFELFFRDKEDRTVVQEQKGRAVGLGVRICGSVKDGASYPGNRDPGKTCKEESNWRLDDGSVLRFVQIYFPERI